MANYANLSLLCASGLMMSQASLASNPAAAPSAAPAAPSASVAPATCAKAAITGEWTVVNWVNSKATGIAAAKIICAPPKERLETKATYQAGDLVKVVYGLRMSSKGRVLGSFASRTGKSQPQDVLDTLKQNSEHMTEVSLLVPDKDRPASWLSDLDVNTRSEELQKHPGLLDPHRWYEVQFKKKEAYQKDFFKFSHVSCLKKIDQAKHDKDDLDDSDDDLLGTTGAEINVLDDEDGGCDQQ